MASLLTFICCAVVAQTSGAPPPALPLSSGTLLILPFKHDPGVEAERTAQLIAEVAAGAAARVSTDKVITGADLQNAADLESQRQSAGCNEGSESCLAELAGAMGARQVLFGNIGRLGDVIVVTLNIYDSVAAQSVARETLRVKSESDLPDAVEAAVGRLLGAAPPPDKGPSLGLVAGGAVTALGVGVGVGGLVLASSQNEVLKKAGTSGTEKGTAVLLGHTFLWGGLVSGLAFVTGGVVLMATSGSEP